MLLLCTCVFSLYLHLVQSQSMFDDPCHLMTVSNDLSQTEGQVQDVSIPANCTTGEFDWHYPVGSLRLLVKPSDPSQSFRVCIEESWATMISGVKDVTGGMDKSLPLPTAEKPSCTGSYTGHAEVLIIADPMLAYMTAFTYRISSN